MKRYNEKTIKYSGQALAISMVVLVVSSLIAISIYSRTMKDKGLTLEERASAEALEVSDVILNKLTFFPIQEVIGALVNIEKIGSIDELNGSEGIVLTEKGDSNDISRLLENLGALEGTTISGEIFPPCPIDQGANEYQLTLKEADGDTYFEIKPGQVWSLPTKNLIEQDDCFLNMKFAIRGDSRAGFSLIKLYCRYDNDGNVISCLEYGDGIDIEGGYLESDDHIENYCFSEQEGGTCNNPNFQDEENWIKYVPEDERDFYIPPFSEEYRLSEIRIKAIAGTIGISYLFDNPSCISGLNMYQLRVTANCSGVYRGKEILIPEVKWHNPIFDYVLFNGEGSV